MTIEQYIVRELKEDIKFLIRKMTQLEQDIEELKNKILNNNKPSVSEKNERI
jgi:transposase|tara:strand:- start:249 stop:404 length:156 start_codon:yes stop_codon:yes gene_type:complete